MLMSDRSDEPPDLWDNVAAAGDHATDRHQLLNVLRIQVSDDLLLTQIEHIRLQRQSSGGCMTMH